MKESLLTTHERTLIKRYLETSECLDGFKVLLHRARKQQIKREVVLEDLDLIEALLKKTSSKTEA